jgi:hypothetical protein
MSLLDRSDGHRLRPALLIGTLPRKSELPKLRKHRGSEMLTAMIYFLGWMWGIDPSGIIADARERALRTIDEKRLPWLEAEMS